MAKTKMLGFRVSVEDDKALRAAARRAGVTVSDYIVMCCLDRAPSKVGADFEQRIAALEGDMNRLLSTLPTHTGLR